MSVDTPQMIAVRVRRQTTNADILALCNAVLSAPVSTVEPAPKVVPEKDCAVCAARRLAKATTQRKWRAKVMAG